jgi:hypothetical protein
LILLVKQKEEKIEKEKRIKRVTKKRNGNIEDEIKKLKKI